MNWIELNYWHLVIITIIIWTFSNFFFFWWVRKVKCALVQALRLCTGRTAHRVSRVIALLFFDHGTRRGWVVRLTLRPLFTPGEWPRTQFTGGWVGPRVGLDGCGKSHPPPGFDPRPETSRYTDWATGPTVAWVNLGIFCPNALICSLSFKIHLLWFECILRNYCQNVNLRSKKSGF